MTAVSLLPVRDDRAGRDRLEILAALISAPSFDPLFRAEIITVPPGHPVYRWNCLVTGCERPKTATVTCAGLTWSSGAALSRVAS
jgi:hypothetical protein